MNKKLVIIGAGGHGQSVAELALSLGCYQRISFIDDSFPESVQVLGLDIIGNILSFFNGDVEFDDCFVAIGNNTTRKKIVNDILDRGLCLVNLLHPSASISTFAKLGKGIAVMAGAVVGTNAVLANGVLVNANCTVDHDCTIDEFAHLGVGVSLASGVKINKGSWLQAGCAAGYNVVSESEKIYTPGTVLN